MKKTYMLNLQYVGLYVVLHEISLETHSKPCLPEQNLYFIFECYVFQISIFHSSWCFVTVSASERIQV